MARSHCGFSPWRRANGAKKCCKFARIMISSSMRFYAYLWLREDGTPYYVGKGQKRRAFKRHDFVKPPVDQSRILLLFRATEDEAYATEKELIANWGRKDINTGRLY